MRSLNLLVLLTTFLTPLCLLAQVSKDSLIHRLEDRERIAILKGDTISLSKLMSKKIVVHNPENTIVGLGQIMERLRIGKISYSSFERSIDTIAFINEIAVVMGEETIIPKGVTKNAGKTIKRRFTNIWTKENGDWKLTARQATIISIN